MSVAWVLTPLPRRALFVSIFARKTFQHLLFVVWHHDITVWHPMMSCDVTAVWHDIICHTKVNCPLIFTFYMPQKSRFWTWWPYITSPAEAGGNVRYGTYIRPSHDQRHRSFTTHSAFYWSRILIYHFTFAVMWAFTQREINHPTLSRRIIWFKMKFQLEFAAWDWQFKSSIGRVYCFSKHYHILGSFGTPGWSWYQTVFIKFPVTSFWGPKNMQKALEWIRRAKPYKLHLLIVR